MKTESAASHARRLNAGDRLRVRHLRLLELIDAGGSLAHAARTLHLSQPGVTKMLQELERAFGATLVTRGARGGQLTPQGHAVLSRLRLTLANFDAALDEPQAQIPSLRVGILPLVPLSLLQGALARMQERNTRVRLLLMESFVSDLMDRLLRGDFDCIVSRMSAVPEGNASERHLHCDALTEDSLVIAAAPGHPLARQRKVTPEKLLEQRWVVAHTGTSNRSAFDDAFVAAGVMAPRAEVESSSFHSNMHLVAKSDLLTLAPASAVALYEGLGYVRRIRTSFAFGSFTLSFITLKANLQLPGMDVLRAALIEQSRA